ncbi:hypothetical protein LINPERPRIM_LOCUS21008 [Linum perenne]
MEAFSRMSKLRLLKICNAKLIKGGCNNDGSDSKGKVSEEVWKLSHEIGGSFDALYNGEENADRLGEISDAPESKEPEKWLSGEDGESGGGAGVVFKGAESGAVNICATEEDLKPWSLGDVEEEKSEQLFELGEGLGSGGSSIGPNLKKEIEKRELEIEEEKLTVIVKR